MQPPAPHQPILLIEDSPEDVVSTKRNLRKSGLRNPVQVCDTGQLALDYLYQRGSFSGQNLEPTPGVILLDLSLPDMEGLEILTTIKQERSLQAIPVIVMTSSHDVRDFEECLKAGADSYLTKPVEFLNFFQAIQRIKGFNFELVILPKTEEVSEDSKVPS